MAIPIGTLGTIPTLTVAGRTFTDLTTLKVLHGWVSTNARATFRAPTGSSGYAVTALKTLTVAAVRGVKHANISATESAIGFVLAQSDNDVGIDSATAFTNPVYMTGAATAFQGVYAAYTGTISFEQAIAMPVAAGKFLGVLQSATTVAASFTGYGYET